MSGKLQNRHSSCRRSCLRFVIPTLFVGFFILVIWRIIFSAATPSVSYSVKMAGTERSFVASLEHFLINKAPMLSLSVRDDTVRGENDDLARKLDDMVFDRDNRLLNEDPAYPLGFPVKVYVYEMPRKFTYDLLWLFHNTYKETSNLTSNGSPVHRLIEQHSIDYWLWADLIAPESERRLKSVVRVHQQQDADVFYVPFFTTISFFLLEKQQCKTLYRVKL